MAFALALAAFLLAVPSAGCPTSSPRATSSPSVLLITIDSLRADRLGYAGHAAAATPSLDALARRSIRFREAQTPSPMTAPALASLLVGRYPSRHGLRAEERHALPDSETTLAETLAEGGYRTGAVAGSLLLHPKFGLDQGFADYWEAFAEIPRPREAPVVGVLAARVVERAMEWLETGHKERFFLWVNFHDPHYFYSPPPPYDLDYADRPYDGEVAYVDRELGRLLDRLRDYGAEERTLIIVAGSHGEGLMDHGEAYHGTLLYQPTLHVPLLIKPAGAESMGRDVTAPVSLVDIMPTVLEIAGLPAPEGIDGRSLAAGLSGGDAGLDPERPLLAETELPTTMFGYRSVASVREGRWKYIASGARGRLFDLAEEPGESTDLSSSFPDIASRLAAHLTGRAPAEAPACGACAERVLSLGLPWPAQVGPSGRDVDPESRIDVANDALKAHRTMQRKMTSAAILLHQDVLTRDPDNRVALIELGWLTGLGHPLDSIGPARDMLLKAQRLYAGDGEIYHLLGHMAMLDPGGRARADRLFEVAALLDPLNEEALYDAACGASLAGRKDRALDLLSRSIEAGFRDFNRMRADDDLEPIRGEKRFSDLVPRPAGSPPQPPPPAAGGASR